MTKETILKRLLLENHITVEELIILGTKDVYETRDPQSFPPKQKSMTEQIKEYIDSGFTNQDKRFYDWDPNKNNPYTLTYTDSIKQNIFIKDLIPESKS